MTEGDAAQGDTFKDGIGQIRGVDHEVAEAGRSIGSNDEAVGEALAIDDIDAGEDGVHGLCEGFDEPKIAVGASGVDDRDAGGGEM